MLIFQTDYISCFRGKTHTVEETGVERTQFYFTVQVNGKQKTIHCPLGKKFKKDSNEVEKYENKHMVQCVNMLNDMGYDITEEYIMRIYESK